MIISSLALSPVLERLSTSHMCITSEGGTVRPPSLLIVELSKTHESLIPYGRPHEVHAKLSTWVQLWPPQKHRSSAELCARILSAHELA